MREFGRVHSAFWRSETVADMSEDARLLALYLMTCDHGNLLGAFYLPDGYAAEDLGWGCERVSEGFRELLRVGFAARCAASKWVWLVRYMDFNPLENPNQVKAAARIAQQVPRRCQWLRVFHGQFSQSLGLSPLDESPKQQSLVEPLRKGSETLAEQGEGEGEAQGEGKGVAPQQAAPPLARAPRGSRLAEDWQLPRAWGDAALAEGWSVETVRMEARKFFNHWTAKTGQDATKLDWRKTWDNWLLKVPKHGHGGRPSKQAQAEADAAATEREWLAQQGVMR